MTEIIIPNKKDPHDVDKPKDCEDFIPLNDGTIAGDRKYCDLSSLCKQVGMLADWHEWYEVYTNENGEVVKELMRDYLCTGKCPIWEERSEDSEAR